MAAEAKANRRRPRAWVVLLAASVAGAVGGVVLERSGAPVEAAVPGARDTGRLTLAVENPTDEGRTAPPVPKKALAGLPAYPGARPEALGQGLTAQGEPMAAAFFSTPDPLEDVVHYYAEALKEQGLPVMGNRLGPNSGYVGYLDQKTHRLHLVTVVRQGDRTLVFPSNNDPEKMLAGEAKVPSVLPHPPAAEDTTVVSMHEGTTHQDSVMATVPLVSVPSLAAFYKKGFIDKGWHVDSYTVNGGADARVEASRGSMRAQALLRQSTDDKGASRVELYVILITQSRA